jgi:alpha-2-macroglobulin
MKSFFIIVFLAIMATLSGQNLLSSRQSGYYTYIFRITDAEARKIYTSRNDRWLKQDGYFHTIVDSFPLYTVYPGKLKPGHYLKVSVKKNQLEASVTSVLNVNVQVVNNNTDLCVQVYDSNGVLVRDAEVKADGKNMNYDELVQGFLLKKANRKGILEVKYNGITSLFNLSKDYNLSTVRKFESILLIGTPLKYVWVPVKFIVAAPVITIKDLINGQSYSIGSDLVNYWPRNGFRRYNYNGHQKKGYFVFNKIKYMPGDTVKFKAFLVNNKGKPLKKELTLKIEKDWRNNINLGKISPLHPGNYNGKFVLADSFNLDLDRNYKLCLNKGKWSTYSYGLFRYEDYELKNLSVSVRPDSSAQMRGRRFRIHIHATDENNLNIQDGRIELTLISNEIIKQFDKNVFLRDTLFSKKLKLEQSGETLIAIPDSLFPHANFSYSLDVKVLRSDNEYKTFKDKIQFYDHNVDITFETHNDSIFFISKENGKLTVSCASISGIDRFGFSTVPRTVTLPLKEKINTSYQSYKIVTDGITKNIQIGDGLSLIQCEPVIENDSLIVKVINPRNLPFTWFLYQRNSLESKGYGTSFNFNKKVNHKTRYFLSLIYLWSGRTIGETYDLSGNMNDLNIKVDQPPLVYPGQKVRMGITVTDFRGRPVENVDLTALSYTSKFNSDPSGVYRFPDARKSKKLLNNFRIQDYVKKSDLESTLDYRRWNRIFSLDTIEYYKFLHHKEDIRFYSYKPVDGLTQFAPYVVSKGEPVRINVIYIDRVPVYFDWIRNNQQPYSFSIDSGFHFVEIRTPNKIFKIDSVYFKYGQKQIISINDLDEPSSFKVQKVKPSFDENEKYSIARYLFPYRNNFGNDFAYLRQNGKILLLNAPGANETKPNSGYNTYLGHDNSMIAGPLKPDKALLKVVGNYSHSFLNEPGFEFEFSDSVIKMRSIERKDLISGNWYGSPMLRFADLPLSEKRVLDSYNEYLFQKKLSSAKFNLPKNTLPSFGKLILEIDSLSPGFGPVPIFVILMPPDKPERTVVYPGNITSMENIVPGLWSVILFYRGDSYCRYDSIQVRAGGRNYIHLKHPGKLSHDNFSIKLNEIIENQVYRTNDQISAEFGNYLKQFQRQQALSIYSGEGIMVTGNVKDKDGPLPGVIVMVKGTTIGTVTDLNGDYGLVVPYNNKELIFSYIGYKTTEIQVGSEFANITLEPEALALQEVVVTGYGVTRRLSGVVSSVSVTQNSSQGIRIRGSSSINAANAPLYIIDGVPYNGDLSNLDPGMLTNIQIIKDESLTSLYGSRAANGVIMISTSGMKLKNPKLISLLKGAEYDSTFMQEVSKASSVRTNFRDFSYWKPVLFTDKNGKVSFEIKFPDDVTNWSTYVLAMNGRKQSGFVSGSVKSYKPLMAQLYTPRFLIEGDSTNLFGKILNYTSDTVSADVHYEINGSTSSIKGVNCINSITDTLGLYAKNNDTLKVKYFFERKDGYIDGEERKIPVFRKGLEMTSGKFFILNGDTTVSVSNNAAMGEGKLFAQTDRLEVISSEIENLFVYSYECNEQMASKLFALLSQEVICRYNKKAFLRKLQVNRLIRAIERNQNPDGCWGWWDRSETSLWVTNHVIGALSKAKLMGYSVQMNKRSLNDYVIWKLESNLTGKEKLDLLYIMSFTDEKIDYRKYISGIDEVKLKMLPDKFRLLELKQKLGLGYSIDSVLKYQNTTMFGNIYFGKLGEDKCVYLNQVQTTLAAYRILKNSGKLNADYLERIRNFLFERRRLGSWQNTYESASVIVTILPDLLKASDGEIKKSSLILSGSVNKKVTDFPFELKTQSSDSISILKTGTFPVYLTSYQHYWKSDPSTDTTYFSVTTSFENSYSLLKSGKPAKMKISLRVSKDAQFVMMEIPIPGGCSYDSKNGFFRSAEHTEFFKDHVAVFFENLTSGKYDYEIELLPRYSGRYTLNPAKAGLMYFPLYSSNNALKTLIIN